ncbi:peptide chain release factor N(5)-glutamine methyltransferase [Methylopila sp. 73B]|uniref:peptide chain release factor N(5)-glutamine methyltransferase n=1 Tax=Methylopila sp. 73B TaxID=1120792 RepID=UPI00035E5A5E|nr:peptide chain release factor N(5)-glutamine methyltransferase [Methylopila sp. 73B]
MTLGEAARAAASRFAAAGIDTPEADARALAREAFGLDAARLIARASDAADVHALARLEGLIRRRLGGEPVDRILGRREFWGLDFTLAPETLAPRGDTETIVQAALDAVGGRDRPIAVLDLGVGSGCILLALLSELPRATGLGVDRSFGAARAARANAERLGLGARARVVVGDWATALGSRFDLVVSNPPYIASADMAGLDREVREHDPARALDGGADGLDAYRAIVADLPARLNTGGAAVLELGAGQETDVARLASQAGLRVDGAARIDLGGVPRALVLGAAT